MRKIGGLLGRSPFGPLHEHMVKVRDGAARVVPMLEAFVRGDRAEVAALSAAVTRLEREADHIKNDIREQLSTSLFTAVERAEVMQLLKAQDDIADNTEALALLLDARATPVPDGLREGFVAVAHKVRDCVTLLAGAVEQLGRLPEAELGPEESTAALQAATEVSRTCEAVEEGAHALLKHLFGAEGQLDPVSVLLLAQVAHELAQVAKKAENSAEVLARLVARR